MALIFFQEIFHILVIKFTTLKNIIIPTIIKKIMIETNILEYTKLIK